MDINRSQSGASPTTIDVSRIRSQGADGCFVQIFVKFDGGKVVDYGKRKSPVNSRQSPERSEATAEKNSEYENGKRRDERREKNGSEMQVTKKRWIDG